MNRPISLLVCFALLPVVLSAQTMVVVDTTIIMSDGVQIEALYVIPVAASPATGYPAILSIHGFSGSKEQLRSNAVEFARNGYIATAYSVRGQGGSRGQFDFFNSPRILDDLRELIAFTKSRLGVNPQRVGVIGGSQGGLHAWAASAYNMDVRAVISMIANGRFLENWTENNAMNFTFAGTIANTTVKMAPHIRSTVQTAIQSNNLAPVERMLDTCSTAGLEPTTSVPVMMMFSYYDQYFNPTPGLRQFHRIGAPKRCFTYPAEHSLSSDPNVSNALAFAGVAWFEYWLKDNPGYAGILSTDMELVMFDGADNMPHYFSKSDTAIWLDTKPETAGITPMKLYFDSGTLMTKAPETERSWAFSYIGGLGSNPVVFRSEPLPKDATLSGAAAYVQLISSASASRYQANVDLYDYDPATQTSKPITRGHYQQNNATPGERNFWRFYLNAMMHTVRAGHRIEARLHGGKPALFTPVNNEVLATGTTSVNTLYSGGQSLSYIQLYAYESGHTSTEFLASPGTAQLQQNYPNPFGAGAGAGMETTYIPYRTTSRTAALDVFNSMGQRIATLHSSGSEAGNFTATFNAHGLPAGVYFAVLRDGKVHKILPMIVVR